VRRRVRALASLGLALLAALPAPASSGALARADAVWARRAEDRIDAVARPERVSAAIAAYQAAIAEAPESLEAHWKLLRALWYSAHFATHPRESERRTYEQALEAGERAFVVLAAQVGGPEVLARAEAEDLRARTPAALRRDAAELYFWYAVNLGAWSRIAGLLQAVRSGVANRLHGAVLRSIALDPDVEQGGAIRLLSRLHSELPRVPLVSGWVDPARAVPLAERAAAEYPEHPGNAYLLGLALLAHAPERRDEAVGLIEATAALEPRPEQLIEDLATRQAAREEIEKLRRQG
jgi:tetratricopeptide (TPR) repeat protein